MEYDSSIEHELFFSGDPEMWKEPSKDFEDQLRSFDLHHLNLISDV